MEKKRITLQIINKQKVIPIKFPDADKKIKGFDICSEVYANIALIAKKKSGKTMALNHIVKECIGKGTKEVFIFATTLYKDRCWKEIRSWLDKKKIAFQGFTSINQDGVNQIETLIERLNLEAEDEENETVDEAEGAPVGDQCDNLLELMKQHNNDIGKFLQNQNVCTTTKKKKKDKYLCPEYFIILDDIGNQLKNPALTTLLNWNRHYKAKVIISTQYLNHLLPDSRKMLDLWLLFKGHPVSKLEEIYADCDSSIPLDLFVKLYHKATKHKYSFFYYDTAANEYRRNFSERFQLPEDQEDEEI